METVKVNIHLEKTGPNDIIIGVLDNEDKEAVIKHEIQHQKVVQMLTENFLILRSMLGQEIEDIVASGSVDEETIDGLAMLLLRNPKLVYDNILLRRILRSINTLKAYNIIMWDLLLSKHEQCETVGMRGAEMKIKWCPQINGMVVVECH